MSPAGGFLDDFDGPGLDTEVWVPHYLPHWSSRAESAATYSVAGSELRLTIPPEQGLWCAGNHDPPLRVSGIQSGVFSGPVGSTIGQQPFRERVVVREFQDAWWGWTPEYGRLEVRARMDLSPRSMAAEWRPGRVDIRVDGEHVKTVGEAPDYPMQMMVAVFDFPDKAGSAPQDHVPELAVDRVRGGPLRDA